jgi:hypothetical protein
MIELEATIDEVALKRSREDQRERQKRCKNRFRALVKKPLNLASFVHVTSIEEDKVHVMKVYVSMN